MSAIVTWTTATPTTPNIYSWKRADLERMMFAKDYIDTLFNYGGNLYSFQSAERENGSGRSFNIKAVKNLDGATVVNFYVYLMD